MDENLSLAPPWWRSSGRAPEQLDSAKELAAAINNDPHYADTIATLLAARPTATQIANTYLPLWKPNTSYTQGAFVVSPTGQVIQANATFTSGATYNASNWTVVAGGSGGSGFLLRDAWTASTAYAVNDVLTYAGQTYAVKTAFTSGTTFSATNLTLWAAKGADGVSGGGISLDSSGNPQIDPAGTSTVQTGPDGLPYVQTSTTQIPLVTKAGLAALMAGILVAGTNMGVGYNSTTGKITLTSSGGGTGPVTPTFTVGNDTDGAALLTFSDTYAVTAGNDTDGAALMTFADSAGVTTAYDTDGYPMVVLP